MHAVQRKPAEESHPRRNHRKLKIALSIIAVLLVVVLLTGWLTNWFGFYGPGAKILNAAKHTLQEGNFTVTVAIDGTQRLNCQVNIDWDRKDLTLLMTKPDGDFLCAIKDNYLITQKISFGKNPAYTAYDITDFLNILFRDSSDEDKSTDWKFILNTLSPGLYDDLNKDIDFDNLEESLRKLLRKTNSNHWLKKNAGFSQSKENGADIYSFEPNTYKLASATLSCFEEAFRNSSAFEAWQKNLDASKDKLQALDYRVDLKVKDDLLTGIDICINQQKTIGILFHRFDSTTIDTARLDSMLNQAECKNFSIVAILNIVYAFL